MFFLQFFVSLFVEAESDSLVEVQSRSRDIIGLITWPLTRATFSLSSSIKNEASTFNLFSLLVTLKKTKVEAPFLCKIYFF